MIPFQYTLRSAQIKLLLGEFQTFLAHNSFERLHLHTKPILNPACYVFVMGRDRSGSLRCWQQCWPHRAYSNHIMRSSTGFLNRLSLCRFQTPEYVNSIKKHFLHEASRRNVQGGRGGIVGGVGTRGKGRKWGAYNGVRLQASFAIKETLYRPLKWQKALLVPLGCDLQLPTWIACLRKATQMAVTYNHSTLLRTSLGRTWWSKFIIALPVHYLHFCIFHQKPLLLNIHSIKATSFVLLRLHQCQRLLEVPWFSGFGILP